MFLRSLDDQEKMAFLELASRAAVVDGVVRAEEADMMAIFRAECGLSEAVYPLLGMGVEAACIALQDPLAARIALIELMALIYADGVMHVSEHALLSEVQSRLGLNDDQLQSAASWVQRLHALYQEGSAFVEGRAAIAPL